MYQIQGKAHALVMLRLHLIVLQYSLALAHGIQNEDVTLAFSSIR